MTPNESRANEGGEPAGVRQTPVAASPAALPVPPMAYPELVPVPTDPWPHTGIRNFGAVCGGVGYRAGQPSPEWFAALAAAGLRTVISLRDEHDDAPLPAGLAYHRIRVVDERAPTGGQVEEFLALARDRASWPWLVHCHGGEHRTGLFVAIWRYSVDGWPLEVCLEEASHFLVPHFGPLVWLIRRTYGILAPPQRRYLLEWATHHPRGGVRIEGGGWRTGP